MLLLGRGSVTKDKLLSIGDNVVTRDMLLIGRHAETRERCCSQGEMLLLGRDAVVRVRCCYQGDRLLPGRDAVVRVRRCY